jgi:hypothetical protein
MISCEELGCDLNYRLSGKSTYNEYSDDDIWDETYLEDIYSICGDILDFTNSCNALEHKSYFGKKIVSIDIETTTWFPKAREGFVNILGMSVLDLREPTNGDCRLVLHQSFNMLRKKEKAEHLIHLAQEFIDDADIMLVFNRSFDINILETVIDNFCIDCQFPETIVDLKRYYKSLAQLEDHLMKQVNFQRVNSEKGSYPDYYKLFKGRGSKGVNKQIEPIGCYNLMDTLSPLYAFLLLG